MKGKYYRPNNENSIYHSMRKSQSYEYPRNYSVASLECVWSSSIPDSWKNLMRKRSIVNVKILKSNRKTLDFLQETQKYIRTICKPFSSELTITPRKSENHEQPIKILQARKSSSHIQLDCKYKHVKIPYLKQRRRINKVYSKIRDDGFFTERSLKNFNIQTQSLGLLPRMIQTQRYKD